VFNTSELL